MNNVVLGGRVVRTPVESYGQENNVAVSRFTLAVARKNKKDEADFVPCIAFGKTAEFVSRNLQKGSTIILSGHINCGSYKDKNGNTVYTTDVVADSIEFQLKSSAESAQQAQPVQQAVPQAQPQNVATPQPVQQAAVPQAQYVAVPQSAQQVPAQAVPQTQYVAMPQPAQQAQPVQQAAVPQAQYVAVPQPVQQAVPQAQPAQQAVPQAQPVPGFPTGGVNGFI